MRRVLRRFARSSPREVSGAIARIAGQRRSGRAFGRRLVGGRLCDRVRRLTYSPHSVQILVFESARVHIVNSLKTAFCVRETMQ